MSVIEHEEFQQLMKKAHLICSTEHGHFIALERKNPYQKAPFIVPKEAETYYEESLYGKMLKMVLNNQILVTAFILR